ncbi:MAG TPA: hypothetical protein VK400_08210 [Pyrinomonadaceae bacterium]|nr:hypothetical protein [Pyrinomonadaceae bacterium]
MRTVIFSLLFFLFLSCVPAQTATAQKIVARGNNTGGIVVTKGKARATINLSADVPGCAYIAAGERKRDLDARECAAPPAGFELIDATVKNNRIFLVLLTETMGNCNVCGQCGATEAYGLIWLQLSANLRLIKKKSVSLEFCLENRSIVSPALRINDAEEYERLNLSFDADVLTVETEKEINGETDAANSYEFSRLEYNRKTPEKGFVIKTEKRAKSSRKD